jgi:broad specificity phosphatase PhoE
MNRMNHFVSKSLLFFSFIFIALSACHKEPETIIKTVVKTDTLIIKKLDTLKITNFVQDTVATFLLVRHAEAVKTDTDPDPELTAVGQARALALRQLLSQVNLAGILSTNFKRTKNTVQPTADDKSLAINTYDASYQWQNIDAWIKTYKGKTALIAGHSNTIPNLVNLFLGKNTFTAIPDSINSNFYIVTVSKKGNGKVMLLKYGN